MKYLFTFLLITLLFGCRNTASHAIKDIGKKVTTCCTALSLAKPTNGMLPAAPAAESEVVSGFSGLILEKSAQLLTW